MTVLVDSTLCPIQRPTDDATQRAYYSGKHKAHGIKYEVGVRPSDGRICHTADPTPGSVFDGTIATEPTGVVEKLLPGEFAGGDKAYQGTYNFIVPFKGKRLTEDEIAFNGRFEKHRVMVERVFGRMKRFSCISKKWRHKRSLHGKCFKVIANLTNLDMKINPMVSQE
eukprot:Lithocolla_globosa_v1_NODE_6447_length_1086_cov_37.549952.p1 type:complete len:168 gc:universal NODE_6447_length_1086_cov_37.549952:402-905(+)